MPDPGIRFSSRLDWSEETNPLTSLLEERRAAGLPLLDLTETNPTRAGLAYDAPGIMAALSSPAALLYEPSSRGLPAAREAVARYYAGRGKGGAAPSPDDIVLCSGTSESYTLLFKILGEPGDEILFPQPSYPLFEHLARLEALRPVPYPLVWREGRWRVDLDALADAAGPLARAVVAVSPNNPTGSYLQPEEVTALAVLCERKGLALIVDEVFHDYPAPGAERPRGDPLAQARALTFVLNGLSKVCALPQLKLAWVIVAGPEAPRREALGRLEFAADTYLSVGTPVQHAAGALLAGRHAIQAQIRERLERNDRVLADACARAPGLALRPREGGWYGVLELPLGLADDEAALALLRDRGVLLHPGFFYDFEEEGLAVVSLLTEPGVFERGVRELTDWLASR